MKIIFSKSLIACTISLSLLTGCSDMMSKIGINKQKEESKKEEQKKCTKKCKEKKCKEKNTSNKKLESEKSN